MPEEGSSDLAADLAWYARPFGLYRAENHTLPQPGPPSRSRSPSSPLMLVFRKKEHGECSQSPSPPFREHSECPPSPLGALGGPLWVPRTPPRKTGGDGDEHGHEPGGCGFALGFPVLRGVTLGAGGVSFGNFVRATHEKG
jgi:hypothetical protein